MATTKTSTGLYLQRCTRAGCKRTTRLTNEQRLAQAWPQHLWTSKHGVGYCAGCGMSARYVPIVAAEGVKECGGVCMGAVGSSCDCKCGGENHGKNHA